ncbi:helix-turn-helix transcriptional regulator [Paenibacillus sp. LHD-117]|uniref:helix-turn-helix domain-containing protein n=1 Tax=Paenibacillus sp. LHD-117 TaxID=3071412 RepID=UPI0027DF3A5E|nr:helix-turn-helix transcriptional regulator [Paenibacillus sp. LHD-117]MDQ6418700.1 helix-turn-helix transcriptional regulator [Paenibacillus sp. LHD-117]
MKLEIGELLLACRVKAGLSQEMLAERLNISRSCVSKYERNRNSPDIYIILQWAEVTNTREVIVAYLFGVDSISLIHNVMQSIGA